MAAPPRPAAAATGTGEAALGAGRSAPRLPPRSQIMAAGRAPPPSTVAAGSLNYNSRQLLRAARRQPPSAPHHKASRET